MVSVFYSMRDLSASSKNCLKTTAAMEEFFDVTLISTFSDFGLLSNYFGIKRNFEYQKRGIGINNNILFELFDRLIFSILSYTRIVLENPDIVYTRDTAFIAFLALLPKRNHVLAFECHKLLDENKKFPTFLQDFAMQNTDVVFCVSNGVKFDVEDKLDKDHKVFIQRNCVDIAQFEGIEKSEKTSKTTLTYIGTFKESKDVATLINTFKKLDKTQFDLKLIGSRDSKLFNDLSGIKNIEVTGFLPEKEVMTEIKESDILIYTSDKSLHQRRYTSPMKLFEYMASKRPIIAADLPTVKEIAGESVWYYEPGNSKELARKIKEIKKVDTSKKTSEAFDIVQSEYTWKKKAEFVNQKLDTSYS